MAVVVAFPLFSACAPVFMSGAQEEVSGEFRLDGGCDATTSRGALAPPNRRTRLDYTFGGISNAAPDGYTVHVLRCAPETPRDSMWLRDGRTVIIMISLPANSPIPAGRYRIIRYGVSDGDVFTATVSMRHPAFDVGTRGAGLGGNSGNVWLTGTSGELEILHIDPPGVPERGITSVPAPRVQARFRMKARREWSMG